MIEGVKKKIGKKMIPELEKKITSSENELKLLMFQGITMYLDEISPNYYNPIEGAKYMELKLRNE